MGEGRTKAGLMVGSLGLLCLVSAAAEGLLKRGQVGPVWRYWDVLILGSVALVLVPFATALLWVSWLDWKRGRAGVGRLV